MSRSSQELIEQFNIDINEKNFNDSKYDEVNEISNDNIIYQTDDSIVDLSKTNQYILSTPYCGIQGDSELSVVLNIVASAIGGGCFNFAFILYQIGLPLFLLLFLFVTGSIYYSFDLLRSFVVDTKFFSLGLMTYRTIGEGWLKIYSISSFIYYSIVEINYLSLIYSYLIEIIKYFLNTYTDYLVDDNYADKRKINLKVSYLGITILFEIFLCLYINKVEKLHLLSLLSVLSFFIILICLIFESVSNYMTGVVEKKFETNFISPHINNKFAVFSYLVEFIYGYSYHSPYPTLIGNLQNVNYTNSSKVHLISFLMIAFSYLIISFFGYLSIQDVPQILFIIDNKKEDSDTKIIIFKCILCLFLFSLIPIRFIVIRENYSSLIRKRNLSCCFEFLIVTSCITVYNAIVFFINEIKEGFSSIFISGFIQLFGGIFGVFIGFLLPVVNYASINGTQKIRSIMGYIVFGIFSIIGTVSVCYSIFQIFFYNEQK